MLWVAIAQTLSAQASIPPDMAFIQGGTFSMGCTIEQAPNCNPDENLDEVTLTDFYIGRYEITQGQWESVMGYTQAQMRDLCCPNNTLYGLSSTNPIYYVSWYDVIVFCNRLSEQQGYTPCYYSDLGYTQVFGKSGTNWSLPTMGAVFRDIGAKGYRLPTEAEWEYAARGGSLSKGYKYSGGNVLSDVGWYDINSNNTTRAVGTKKANELGLFDMSGNVWEWCYDWYSSSYYSVSPPCSPLGPTSGLDRVLRGGSWYDDIIFARSACRNSISSFYRNFFLGLRVCRTP